MIEIKWLMIAFAVIMSGLAVNESVTSYNRSQCRIAAIQAGHQSDDIAKICGK